MQRRHVLAALALPLAGCTEVLRSSDPTGGGSDSTPDSETPDVERTPTEETDRVTATPETEHPLGEIHTYENWRLAVETVDLSATLRTDEGERYEMPADEQLLVARVAVENTADGRDAWSAGLFAAVADERGGSDGDEATASGRIVGRPTLVVEHPAFADRPEGGLRVEDLARVEHAQQFDAQGYTVDAGQRSDVWLVVVVPRELDRHDVAVAFDGDFRDDAPFPVWWVPEVGSETVG